MVGAGGSRSRKIVTFSASIALTVALEPPAETVVVCGSIYLVGEVRRLLRQRFGIPVAAAELEVSGGRSVVRGDQPGRSA